MQFNKLFKYTPVFKNYMHQNVNLNKNFNNNDNNHENIQLNNVFIVIAAYNEEKTIAGVINGLKNEGYNNIIVVDDCSMDKTGLCAENSGAITLRHIVNRGQGASLKTGIDHALSNGADVIVTFDADGQHMAEDIKKLLNILDNGYDIALGSRFIDNRSNVPLLKKIVLKCAIIFTRLTSGIKLTDTHNGLRALSRKAAKRIEIKQDRMAHASEILDEIVKKRLSYKEAPVFIRYTSYSKRKGQSIFNSLNIAAKIMLKRLVR